jgi:hypothetical protein
MLIKCHKNWDEFLRCVIHIRKWTLRNKIRDNWIAWHQYFTAQEDGPFNAMYVTLWPAQYVSVSFKVKWIAVTKMLVYQCIVSTQTSFVNFLFWDIFFCSEVFCWCEEIHIFVCDCTQVHTERLEAASFQNLETLVLTLHTWRRLAIYYFVSAFHKNYFLLLQFSSYIYLSSWNCAQFGHDWTNSLPQVSSFGGSWLPDCHQVGDRWSGACRPGPHHFYF